MQIIACLWVLVALIASSGNAAEISRPPARWDAEYWKQGVQAAESARQRDDRVEADRWCGTVVPYAEEQTLRALFDYANVLHARRDRKADEARANAERLKQIMTERQSAHGPSNADMGFDPSAELTSFAGLLDEMGKRASAESMRTLAGAYRHAQATYIRRTMLQRMGKNPTGEC